MKNILVIDVQYGYLDDSNRQLVSKLKEYFRKNKFENSIFTMFVTNYKDNFYKNMFWEGIYDKQEQKIAVKKPMHSKVFKKKNYGLTPSIYKYLKEKNITEIELCGINIMGAIYVIAKQLQRLGINVVLKNEFVFKSKVDNMQFDINYMPNILKTINGFYFGDMLYNAYKNKNANDNFPYVKKQVDITDGTILSFAVIEWLISSKQETQELFKILNYYYKLFPNKDNKIYTQDYAIWAENGCRTFRVSDDNLALRMCNIIGWYAKSLEQIDELIKKGIVPLNNSADSECGSRILCYTLYLLRSGANRFNILKYISKYFNLNFKASINDLIKQKQPATCTNIAYLVVLIFAQTSTYKDAINTALAFDCDQKTLTLATSVIAESYYRNMPYYEIFDCRKSLPEKFQKLLMKFIYYCKRY